ncbi:unnamed protein product [Miscanthus lutarioriparius]|uniref:DUF659 domain-containing protein n=1 Tax=Miscanthus lutarioriparius TaxID=422564 RepID=A0A811SN79_9POAL|nr:unnamed protein product [Miscanthus lutarioriparius]
METTIHRLLSASTSDGLRFALWPPPSSDCTLPSRLAHASRGEAQWQVHLPFASSMIPRMIQPGSHKRPRIQGGTIRQFQIAVEATAQFGSGYKPPTPYQLGEPLLKEAVKSTSTMREEHERAWKQYGCTLMSDGWSDRRGRHLINFLVNSPEGTYFLESVDASSEVHDAKMLADLLEERIDDIGKDKVVQVVTDNGANFKAAGKLLMERIPTIFWSPCAAHCLDLMLEEIGNLPAFKKYIARARRVTTFIYRHGRILHAMRRRQWG